jgi:hypothetical protein
MKFLDFFKKGFFLFSIFAIFLILLTVTDLVTDGIVAAWTGLILGYLNFLGGTASLCTSFSKPDKQFYSVFFGGMIVRFAILFLILLLLIIVFHMNKIWLISSLLVSYVSFMIIEIWVVHKFSITQGKGS